MKVSTQSNEKGKPELSAQATNKIVICQYCNHDESRCIKN